MEADKGDEIGREREDPPFVPSFPADLKEEMLQIDNQNVYSGDQKRDSLLRSGRSKVAPKGSLPLPIFMLSRYPA